MSSQNNNGNVYSSISDNSNNNITPTEQKDEGNRLQFGKIQLHELALSDLKEAKGEYDVLQLPTSPTTPPSVQRKIATAINCDEEFGVADVSLEHHDITDVTEEPESSDGEWFDALGYESLEIDQLYGILNEQFHAHGNGNGKVDDVEREDSNVVNSSSKNGIYEDFELEECEMVKNRTARRVRFAEEILYFEKSEENQEVEDELKQGNNTEDENEVKESTLVSDIDEDDANANISQNIGNNVALPSGFEYDGTETEWEIINQDGDNSLMSDVEGWRMRRWFQSQESGRAEVEEEEDTDTEFYGSDDGLDSEEDDDFSGCGMGLYFRKGLKSIQRLKRKVITSAARLRRKFRVTKKCRFYVCSPEMARKGGYNVYMG